MTPSGSVVTSHSHMHRTASTFYDTPITNGPFRADKYGKPTKKLNKTAPPRDNIRGTLSSGRSSKPEGGIISRNRSAGIEDSSSTPSNFPKTSNKPEEPTFQTPLVAADKPASQFLFEGSDRQVTSAAVLPGQESKRVISSGAASRRIVSAKPVANLAPPTSNTSSAAPDTSQALVLRLNSVSDQSAQPVTKGRPLVRLQEQFDLGASKMTNSNQANTYSVASAGVHPSESPMERLKRVQRDALIQRSVASRRQNKHDTAFPEVLAYIRKPLELRVTEVVERRVAHYWMIGNENLPATTSVDVEPNWPEGIDDPDAKHEESSHKRSREVIATPSAGILDTPVASSKPISRWVTNAEVRAPPRRLNSNAWGSVASSATTANTQDSVQVEVEGGGVKLGDVNADNTGLLGWDGKMQPPPVDWHDRPRFDNNTVEHQNGFNNWSDARAEVLDRATHSHTVSFRIMDLSEVLDVSNHADGLGFVSATTAVTAANAEYYGYARDSEVKELAKLSVPLTEHDFEITDIVEMGDLSTAALVDETTEMLVQRWIGQNGWLENKRAPSRKTAMMLAPPAHYQALAAPETPEIRISLRPATVSDIPGMTRIYNWYVENSPRTTEFDTIPESDMRGRFDDVRSNKLPFLVAVARNRVRGPASDTSGPRANARRAKVNGHPVTNTNPSYQGLTEEETIVGWACASDFTASDYVERITAECELYVAHGALQLGVGKALMDKLLEACDRGYAKQGGYDWRCAPDFQHLYSGGGGRDLHKLYFVVRKYNKPTKTLTNRNHGKRPANARARQESNDRDDEWDAWLKDWMELWGFEEEGCLKQVGAKNGRL